jgi:hypothetical protein
MPRGVRTDRISERDLEVLGFIARYGVVPRQAVSLWADPRRTVTQRRERRLRLAGLVELKPAFAAAGPFAIATRSGLRACGRAELRPARLSWGEVLHQTQCALVGAELERGGAKVLSEREIMAAERLAGKRPYSADVGQRYHRPDLIRLDFERVEAIEVELTPKGATRLDAILRAWRRAVVQRRLGRVLYLCCDKTLPTVERSIARTKTNELIHAEPLPDFGLGRPANRSALS